jgi:hypothetical protein
MMRIKCFLFSVLVLFLSSTMAFATGDDDWDINVSNVSMGAISKTDFIAGWKYKYNNTVSYKADDDWKITVKSQNSSLGTSSDGTYTKALSDLSFKRSTASAWTTMTQQNQILKTGTTHGQGSFYIDFRARLRWAYDRPGNYGCTLLFTISED